MKNKNAQLLTETFSQIVKTSKRKPNLLETDDGEGYVDEIINEFLNNKKIESFFRYTDKGALLAERFNRTIRTLFKRPVIGEGNANCLSELPSVIKKCYNTIHSSTCLKPIQASNKSNDKKSVAILKIEEIDKNQSKN